MHARESVHEAHVLHGQGQGGEVDATGEGGGGSEALAEVHQQVFMGEDHTQLISSNLS